MCLCGGFMENIIFFDVDDCLVKSGHLQQKEVNSKTEFTDLKLKVLESVERSLKVVLEYNEFVYEDSVNKNTRPNLIATSSAGSNDIMRNYDEKADNFAKEELKIQTMAYNDAHNQVEMFKEERDHFLELNNMKSAEDGIIDYDMVYSESNLINDGINTVFDFLDDSRFKIYTLSHHNGGRELESKKALLKRVFNDKLKFVGLRFHAEEYQKGVRRGRSSKAMYAMNTLGIPSLEKCVLIDDSTENLDEWLRRGGIPVLYRPLTSEEKEKGELTPHNKPYSRITEMNKEEIINIINGYNKQDKFVKIK